MALHEPPAMVLNGLLAELRSPCEEYASVPASVLRETACGVVEHASWLLCSALVPGGDACARLFGIFHLLFGANVYKNAVMHAQGSMTGRSSQRPRHKVTQDRRATEKCTAQQVEHPAQNMSRLVARSTLLGASLSVVSRVLRCRALCWWSVTTSRPSRVCLIDLGCV